MAYSMTELVDEYENVRKIYWYCDYDCFYNHVKETNGYDQTRFHYHGKVTIPKALRFNAYCGYCENCEERLWLGVWAYKYDGDCHCYECQLEIDADECDKANSMYLYDMQNN